jgi:hypothetical protein
MNAIIFNAKIIPISSNANLKRKRSKIIINVVYKMIQLSLKIANLRANKSSLYEQFAIKLPRNKTIHNLIFCFIKK